MACTRNKNTYCDYILEQRNNTLINDYSLYKYSSNGIAYNTNIPAIGYMPSQIPGNILSKNSTDIESSLFGIGSCNLVKKKPEVVPELNKIPMINFFEYSNKVQIPSCLLIDTDQRPLIP